MGTGDSGHFFLPVGIVKICPFLFILFYRALAHVALKQNPPWC